MHTLTVLQKILCKLQHYISRFCNKKVLSNIEKDPQKASDIIYEKLLSSEPCMIARFGATELWCLANYMSVKEGYSFKKMIAFLKGQAEPWWWMPQRIQNMQTFSGFFPIDIDYISCFCEMLLRDTSDVDILASWLEKESVLEEVLVSKSQVFLPYLEPYHAKLPWTRALKGKNVLVVHPFASQIEHQYHNCRDLLFKNQDVLPDFNLITIQAVQSLGGETNGFNDWFEALEYMKAQMDKVDYDICIIGCGAYGFHLAAHAKRMGKKAIHMGGATQLLFGIKGNRWEDPMYGVIHWGLPYGFYTQMFNEHWIKPGDIGRPKNAAVVEGACYW